VVISQFRLFALLGGGGAVIAGGIWLSSVLGERARLRDQAADVKACVAAVKGGGDVLICPQPIADAASLARRYDACDAALSAGEAYGVQAACPEAVKRRDAEAAAATHNAAQLAAELARTRAQAKAALSRAEARTQTILRKEADANKALNRAPTGPAGGVRCDDDCLRSLFGE